MDVYQSTYAYVVYVALKVSPEYEWNFPFMQSGFRSRTDVYTQTVQFSVRPGVLTVLDPFKSLKFVHPAFALSLSARWSMLEPRWDLCLCEAAAVI